MTPKKKLENNDFLIPHSQENKDRPEIPVSINLEDSKRLLKELQLKLIELEYRNEQLITENFELVKKKEYFSEIFSKSKAPILIIDNTGQILDINSAALALLKINQERQDINFRKLIAPQCLDIFDTILLVPEINSQFPLVLKTFEDGEFHAQISFTLLSHHSIQITISADSPPVVEEKTTHHEQLYQAIGESINYGIWVCTPDGRNIYASDSFLNLLGITQQQCSDFGWGTFLHPDDSERTMEAWKHCVDAGGTWDFEHRYKGIDGKWHHMLAKGVPVKNKNNEIIYWAGINLDIEKQKQIEYQLKESESNFKYAERIAHLGSFQYNIQTGSCSWSDEFFRICGFEPQSFIPDKEKFLSFVHQEDRKIVELAINNAVYHRTKYKQECRILRPNGEIRHLISVGQIITNKNNEPFEIKGAIQDVTELKNIQLSLRASEDKYRVLFESMPIGLAILDTSGKIIYGNKKSRTLLGVSRTELKQGMIDLSRWEFVHKKDSEIRPADIPDLKELYERRVMENNEVGLVKFNNQVTWFNVTAAPLQDREEILIAFIDISEQVERENQLKLLSEKLKELNATKDKFFSIIAHDLKNPFNSILGFSELLLKNLSKYNNHEIERFIGIINSTSQNAYNLLENLLNWSRSQTGTIEFNPRFYNLDEIINANIDFVKNLALKKTIKISFESTVKHWVIIDKNMIDTVLRNLLTNSIKFSFPGGKIRIAIDTDGNYYKVSITDNGIGIEAENIDKLFRIDSKHSSYGTNQEKGSGLGLIISKEFIEKNKGNIWAHSEFGKGSEFFFTLLKAADREVIKMDIQ